jgi:ADP-dependent NAD(P)H-hydrate dehydratase / NAD(P)H-hydrate epimerase
MTLPPQLYSTAQVRQLEAKLIAAGTPGAALMERAGAAAYACMRSRWPALKSIAVICGGGNNGGDGQVLARLARQDGLSVRVCDVGKQPFDPACLAGCELVIDALLGIGVRAPLSTQLASAIGAINASHLPVLAIDVPSGLDPDTGIALPAVRASATLAFIALKQGLFMADGPEHAGEVLLDPLGCGPSLADALMPGMQLLTDEDLRRALAPRSRQGHKGHFGKVVVVGGGVGMPGAVRLAAESALRVGAGLVTVASRPEHLQVVTGNRPELIFRALADAGDVRAAIESADVVLVGPGLGRDDWARAVLTATFACATPGIHVVVDADALNLVSEGVALQRSEDWVLTPHPAEAARLLNMSTDEVQRDRATAMHALCKLRGGTVVLKGASTLVGHQGQVTRLCNRGNPGMAVPGMGDVLAGAIAGILAQGRDPFLAASAGVHAHATAGDRCALFGVRGMLAMDVATELRSVLAFLP